MEEHENIDEHLLRVDEFINIIRHLDETIDDTCIIDKVLRMLPKRFDTNVLGLEERKYIDSISMDELHGILTAYEMRT